MMAAPDIIFDLRCLQDRHFVDRGIGRHASNLLNHVRATRAFRNSRLIALTDPELPPLPAAARSRVAEERHTAFIGQARGPTWLVSPSPMTHDPLLCARLLLNPAVRAAAVVHDFIPLTEPDIRLRHASDRAAYRVRLHWLSRFDLFLTNSQATANRLTAIIGAPSARITVTGVGLDPGFQAAAAAKAGNHLLAIGGDDERKNIPLLVRAHAASRELQERDVELVVVGFRDPAEIARLQREAKAAGGNPSLLRPIGFVTDAELASLYGRALAVVVPSRLEGFSLPVIEAMAAAVPVLVSDIDVHRELVETPEAFFEPDDQGRLSRLLEQLFDAPWRSSLVVAQSHGWQRFKADLVAARFWDAIAAATSMPTPTPTIRVGKRPKIALLTPLPPAQSGVADYSAATCKALGALTELDVFSDTPRAVTPNGAARLLPLSAFPGIHPSYERVINVIGNSIEQHGRIFGLTRRFGGAVIAHDARMLAFFVFRHGASHAAEIASRELGREVRDVDIFRWMEQERDLPTLLLGPLLEVAEPFFVHSRGTATLIERLYGNRPAYLPFCIQRMADRPAPTPAMQAAARLRLGLPADRMIIASFGFVHPSKAPFVMLDAISRLRDRGLNPELHLVGALNMPRERLELYAARIGCRDLLRFAGGFAKESDYQDYLIAADAGLQLREFGFGSVSGTLTDCVAAALPTVANQDLAAAIEAPAYIRRVPDQLDSSIIADALHELIADSRDRARLEGERAIYAATHSFDRYAAELMRGLELA